DGRVDALGTYLASGGSPTVSLLVPGSEQEAVPLLTLAILAGNDAAAVQLLGVGAPVAVLSAGEMMNAAVSKDMLRTLRALIDQDPARFASISSGDHPLRVAVYEGKLEATSIILEKMADYSVPRADEILNGALIVASSGRLPAAMEIVDALLAAGADPAAVPALTGAVLNCSPEMVETFLERDADPSQTYRGRSVADYALDCFDRASRDRARAILGSLHDAGVNLCTLELRERRASVRTVTRRIGECD
ncbi:MAG TPA: hypothetical protein VFV10_16910, partial [Gammaproteobacteria bacterium]|nr:hypothetical protein [Gammaproteobacteria bacterium]